MSELILSLRSSSPSPSVIFPFRSRIVTPSTTRSSICIVEPPPPPCVFEKKKPRQRTTGFAKVSNIQRFARFAVGWRGHGPDEEVRVYGRHRATQLHSVARLRGSHPATPP